MPAPTSQISHETSAKWNADFLEDFPTAIYRTTLEGTLVFCNKAFARMFGFDSSSELTGYPEANLYHNKKHRGRFVAEVLKNGSVEEFPLLLTRKGGAPFSCAVTARAVFDEDGIVVFIDGAIHGTDPEADGGHERAHAPEMANSIDVLVITLDEQGKLLSINREGADFLGISTEDVLEKPLDELIVARHRNRLGLFLSDVLKTGREVGILTMLGENGEEHHIELYAQLTKGDEGEKLITGFGREVTERIERQRKQLTDKKFQGVLEMAGGVAHSLNQPLTVVNNLLNKVLSDMTPDDSAYDSVIRIYDQIQKLNKIAKKIGDIRKYEAMDYLCGERIVDIDKASLKK